MLFTDVPNFKLEIKSNFSAGDWMSDEWVMSGTHANSSFIKIPAAGKHFSVPGASITELRQGTISENTDYWNVAAFLQQVGAMPTPPK